MSIKEVTINKRKKCIEIDTPKGILAFPFSKLRVKPTLENNIKHAYVDDELADMAVTYTLESGEEDSVHMDAFLDYNKDPEYMTKMTLYKLTLKALKLVESSDLSKREIARKLKTSPAQLYRLLDTANYSKTIDQMLKLLSALGYEIGFVLRESASPEGVGLARLKQKFTYLKAEELRTTPSASTFRPLLGERREAA
jgi:predicted DNA-binding protein (UPF0251 family)